MIDFKQFTKDAAVHYHLTEAFANYAYWLSSDVESYFDSLEGNVTEDDMKVLSSRYRLCEHVLELADRLNSQDVINDENYLQITASLCIGGMGFYWFIDRVIGIFL